MTTFTWDNWTFPSTDPPYTRTSPSRSALFYSAGFLYWVTRDGYLVRSPSSSPTSLYDWKINNQENISLNVGLISSTERQVVSQCLYVDTQACLDKITLYIDSIVGSPTEINVRVFYAFPNEYWGEPYTSGILDQKALVILTGTPSGTGAFTLTIPKPFYLRRETYYWIEIDGVGSAGNYYVLDAYTQTNPVPGYFDAPVGIKNYDPTATDRYYPYPRFTSYALRMKLEARSMQTTGYWLSNTWDVPTGEKIRSVKIVLLDGDNPNDVRIRITNSSGSVLSTSNPIPGQGTYYIGPDDFDNGLDMSGTVKLRIDMNVQADGSSGTYAVEEVVIETDSEEIVTTTADFDAGEFFWRILPRAILTQPGAAATASDIDGVEDDRLVTGLDPVNEIAEATITGSSNTTVGKLSGTLMARGQSIDFSLRSISDDFEEVIFSSISFWKVGPSVYNGSILTWVEMYDDNGGLPGNLIMTSNYIRLFNTGGSGYVKYTFPQDIIIDTTNPVYFILTTEDPGYDTTFLFRYNNSNPYTYGIFWQRDNGVWSSNSANDMEIIINRHNYGRQEGGNDEVEWYYTKELELDKILSKVRFVVSGLSQSLSIEIFDPVNARFLDGYSPVSTISPGEYTVDFVEAGERIRSENIGIQILMNNQILDYIDRDILEELEIIYEPEPFTYRTFPRWESGVMSNVCVTTPANYRDSLEMNDPILAQIKNDWGLGYYLTSGGIALDWDIVGTSTLIREYSGTPVSPSSIYSIGNQYGELTGKGNYFIPDYEMAISRIDVNFGPTTGTPTNCRIEVYSEYISDPLGSPFKLPYMSLFATSDNINPTPSSWNTFTFANPIPLSPKSRYYIMVMPMSDPGSGNYQEIVVETRPGLQHPDGESSLKLDYNGTDDDDYTPNTTSSPWRTYVCQMKYYTDDGSFFRSGTWESQDAIPVSGGTRIDAVILKVLGGVANEYIEKIEIIRDSDEVVLANYTTPITADISINHDQFSTDLYDLVDDIRARLYLKGTDDTFVVKSLEFAVLAPPLLVSTDPDDTEIGVRIDKVITITFDQAMDTSTPESFITFSPDFSKTFEWQPGDAILKITPDSELLERQIYNFTIKGTLLSAIGAGFDGNRNGISQGSPTDDKTITFTTGPKFPQLVSSDPYHSEGNIPVNKVITLVFSEPMDETSLDAHIDLQVYGGVPIASTRDLSPDKLTYTITPTGNLPHDEDIEVFIWYLVEDEDNDLFDGNNNGIGGENPADNRSIVFHTQIEPPYVISTDPADEDTGILITDDIVIIFSQPMNEAFTEAAMGFVPSILGVTYNWNPGKTTLTISHDPMNHNTEYFVTVRGTAKNDADTATLDGDGNGVAEGPDDNYVFNFTTGGLPPQVQSSNPIQYGIDVEAFQPLLYVVFDQDMDATTTEAAVSSTLANTPTLQPNKRTLEIQIDEPLILSYYTLYDITILASAEGENGLLFDGNKDGAGTGLPEDNWTLQFTTRGPEYPTVVSTDPEDSDIGVPILEPITVIFSEPMNKSITQTAIVLTDETVSGLNVGLSFTWFDNDTRMEITPTGVGPGFYEYLHYYKLVIGTGATDKQTEQLQVPYTIYFTLEDPPITIDINLPKRWPQYTDIDGDFTVSSVADIYAFKRLNVALRDKQTGEWKTLINEEHGPANPLGPILFTIPAALGFGTMQFRICFGIEGLPGFDDYETFRDVEILNTYTANVLPQVSSLNYDSPSKKLTIIFTKSMNTASVERYLSINSKGIGMVFVWSVSDTQLDITLSDFEESIIYTVTILSSPYGAAACDTLELPLAGSTSDPDITPKIYVQVFDTTP